MSRAAGRTEFRGCSEARSRSSLALRAEIFLPRNVPTNAQPNTPFEKTAKNPDWLDDWKKPKSTLIALDQ
jgi:hypothetical protein